MNERARTNPEASELVSEHRPRVVACASRVLGDRDEAEDVAQEVLLRLSVCLGEGPRSVGAWLVLACRRLAIDRLRARRRRERLVERLPRDERAVDASEEAERGLAVERLRAGLAALDEPYRSALELRYLEELPFDEVARRLGTLERTARTWVARGLARLRVELGGGP